MFASSVYSRDQYSAAKTRTDCLGDETSPRDSGLAEIRVQRPAAMCLRADVYEDGDALVVEVELPGLRPQEISVAAEPQLLEIRSEPAEVAAHQVYRRRERDRGSACREIPLPVPVRHDRAEARLRDGVLEVRMPIEREQPGPLRCRVCIAGD
jgi:HSP20 family protein